MDDECETGRFLRAQVGRTYHSPWHTIDQGLVDGFADVTEDHQFIHVDPVGAAATPFGGTIAHGFLLLSLLPILRAGTERGPTPGLKLGVNYGFDRIRFVHPVRVGSRVRGRFVTQSVIEKRPGTYQEELEAALELEGREEPVLVSRWIIQAMA